MSFDAIRFEEVSLFEVLSKVANRSRVNRDGV
jgi:hypothetical protein